MSSGLDATELLLASQSLQDTCNMDDGTPPCIMFGFLVGIPCATIAILWKTLVGLSCKKLSCLSLCLKKKLDASKPSEHLPSGENFSNVF